MKIGLGVICHFDNDAPEPEGTVIFDSFPKIGDEVILSGGDLWEIFKIKEYSLDGYPVCCKRKIITNESLQFETEKELVLLFKKQCKRCPHKKDDHGMNCFECCPAKRAVVKVFKDLPLNINEN